MAYPVEDPTPLECELFNAGLVREVALEEIYDIKGRTSVQQEWQTKEVACRQPNPLDPASWDDKLIAGRRGEFFACAVEGCNRVLDVGCGEGWPSLYLARDVQEVHGLDCSKVHIELARKSATLMGLDNVHFHVGRIESLPFSDGHFDGVCFGGNVLTYRTNPQVLLAEIHRVLKPSGPFALEQWPVDGSQGRWEKIGFFIDHGPPILHYVAGSGPFSRTYFVHIREDSTQGRHLLAVADRADGSELSPAQREGCEQVKQQLEAGDVGTVETVIYGGQDRSLMTEELPEFLAGAGFEDFASWAIPSGRSFAKELKQAGLLQRFQSQDVRPCIRALVRSACRTSNWVHQWVTVRKGK